VTRLAARRTASLSIAAAAALLTVTGAVDAHDPITTRVTWTREIAPIVQARCVTCHSDAGRGPMSLETYEDARPWARAIGEEVVARRMPKWHAARGYGVFSNDPSLSPFEIALISAWAEGGAPRGTDADASAPRPELGRPHVAPGQPREVREATIGCGGAAAPAGRLIGLRPAMPKGESVGIAVRHSSGDRQILAWIRDFDPEFAETYWLREPIDVGPGAAIVGDGSARCSIVLLFSAPGSPRPRE
jgi:mono/diheme cytochrome c family protein